MREINIHHPLAEIKIKPLAVLHLADFKVFIQRMLDGYDEEKGYVTFKEVHERIRKEAGDIYGMPGYYLRIFRIRADLTQKKLAEKLQIKQHHISEMENNKRGIGKELAKKLGSVLKCDYRKFL